MPSSFTVKLEPLILSRAVFREVLGAHPFCFLWHVLVVCSAWQDLLSALA